MYVSKEIMLFWRPLVIWLIMSCYISCLDSCELLNFIFQIILSQVFKKLIFVVIVFFYSCLFPFKKTEYKITKKVVFFFLVLLCFSFFRENLIFLCFNGIIVFITWNIFDFNLLLFKAISYRYTQRWAFTTLTIYTMSLWNTIMSYQIAGGDQMIICLAVTQWRVGYLNLCLYGAAFPIGFAFNCKDNRESIFLT